VRTCFFFVALSLAVAQTSTTYTPDINGNRIAGGQTVAKEGVVTDLRQSINGKEVPLEQVEQKVLSKSGNTTVTERLIRHYGTNGQVVSTERVVSEETKNGNDSSVKSTTYRSDISGNMSEAERKTVETHKSGNTTITDTAVEKKSLSGSFEVAEKRSLVLEPTVDGKKENETVYLRDANGRLYEAQRVATVETHRAGEILSNSAVYEPGTNGDLALAKQNVVKTTTKPDGSTSQEIETFGRASDGRAREAGAAPALTEKRVIERQKSADGSIVQRESVQLPSVNDPGRLGTARTVSETVCRGECKP
jgi:hypothetical protein